MIRTVAFIAAAICLFSLPAAAEECAADNLTRVRGGGECLVIKTYNAGAGAKTLLVFIHGDGSGGGPSDYLFSRAERYGKADVVAVGLIRPGYYDSQDNFSTGASYRSEGDGYRDHVVDAVTGALKELKAFHGAEKLILVGHSGGAAISGVILGREPGLADAAVLAACPCHVPDWRIMRRGSNTWTRSLSPHEFEDKIPAGTRVVAVTGSGDSNTRPEIAGAYIERLKTRGLDARFVDVPGASHNRVTRTDEFFAAIDQLLK